MLTAMLALRWSTWSRCGGSLRAEWRSWLLVREKRGPQGVLSRIRRVFLERPALTARDLLEAKKAFEGRERDHSASAAAMLLLDTSFLVEFNNATEVVGCVVADF
jgi:hypothetical protein